MPLLQVSTAPLDNNRDANAIAPSVHCPAGQQQRCGTPSALSHAPAHSHQVLDFLVR
jgi:hypothetical protein